MKIPTSSVGIVTDMKVRVYPLLTLCLLSCSSGLTNQPVYLTFGRQLYAVEPSSRKVKLIKSFDTFVSVAAQKDGSWFLVDQGENIGTFGSHIFSGTLEEFTAAIPVFPNPVKIRLLQEMLLVDSGGIYQNGFTRYGIMDLDTNRWFHKNLTAPSWVSFPAKPLVEEHIYVGINGSRDMNIPGYIEKISMKTGVVTTIEIPGHPFDVFHLETWADGFFLIYQELGTVQYLWKNKDNEYLSREITLFSTDEAQLRLTPIYVDHTEAAFLIRDRQPGLQKQEWILLDTHTLNIKRREAIEEVDLEWAHLVHRSPKELWFQNLNQIFIFSKKEMDMTTVLTLEE